MTSSESLYDLVHRELAATRTAIIKRIGDSMTQFQVTGGTIDIPLPDKNDAMTPAGVRAIEEGLGSIRAYRPRSIETYTFYEVYDQWLGPWGESGYPIAYGKYYNIQFTRSEPLQEVASTRTWLEGTTVCLQDALIQLAVNRFRAGRLGSLTEPELREAAFGSHVSCYIGSGLSLVLMTDPYLIPLIGAIPIKEFVPFTGNSQASWSQAIQAAVGAPSVAIGVGIASLMPAHSGMFARAARLDAQRRRRMMMFFQRMGRIQSQIERGRVDHLPWLNQVIRELERLELRDPQELRFAREVLRTAIARRRGLIQRYQRELVDAPPEVRAQLQQLLRQSGVQ